MFNCLTNIYINCATTEDAQSINAILTKWYGENTTLRYFLAQTHSTFPEAKDDEYLGVVDDIFTCGSTVTVSVYTKHRPLIAIWPLIVASFSNIEVRNISYVSRNKEEGQYWSNRSYYLHHYVVHWNIPNTGSFEGDVSEQSLGKVIADYLKQKGIFSEAADTESLVREAEYFDDITISPFKVISACALR